MFYLHPSSTPDAVPLTAHSGPLRLQWLRSPGETGGRLRMTLPVAGPVRVSFYDALGREVAVPLRQALPAGAAEVRWDGRDAHGRALRSGVFYARVDTQGGDGAIPAVILR